MSLEIKIKKKLGSFELDVDFSDSVGSLGLLGASGSGKSLTLRSIAGIETPDSGRIVVDGRVLFDSESRINLKPQQRKIGFLLQNYALFPHMTAAQNITCALRLSRKEKLKKVSEMSGLFRLHGLEQLYPPQLSGGQQQRVAMARIFAAEPQVLLLDEPFSALDSYLRERLQIELWELISGYKGSIILVTHSRDEVYRLCENTVILADGKSIVKDNTKALFKQPRTLAAAKITGCKNISRAERISGDEVLAIDWGIRLKIPPNPDGDFAYIGIRAHDFSPENSGSTAENLINIRVMNQYENPFEWNIMFAAKNAESSGGVWWKYAKTSDAPQIPEYLSVKRENILLLTK